jgi:hypothetical protein
MTGDNFNVRLTIDSSEVDEAVALIQKRRALASPSLRAEIDNTVAAIKNGAIPNDRVVVFWRQNIEPGHLHVTAGPVLLDLALSPTEVAVHAPPRLGLPERLTRDHGVPLQIQISRDRRRAEVGRRPCCRSERRGWRLRDVYSSYVSRILRITPIWHRMSSRQFSTAGSRRR